MEIMDTKICLLQNLIILYGFESLTDYNFKLYNYKITKDKEKILVSNLEKNSDKIKEIFNISLNVKTSDQAIKLLRELLESCNIKYLHSRDSKSSYTKLVPKDTNENLTLVGDFVFDTEVEHNNYYKYALIGDKVPEYAEELTKISEKPTYDHQSYTYYYCIPSYGDMVSGFLFIINLNEEKTKLNLDNINRDIKFLLDFGTFEEKLMLDKVFIYSDKLFISILFNKWINKFMSPKMFLKIQINNNDYNKIFKKISFYGSYIFLQNHARDKLYTISDKNWFDEFINESVIPSNIPSNIHERQLEYVSLKNINININELNLGYLRAIYINQLPLRAKLIISGLYRFDLSTKLIQYYKNIYDTPKDYYILPLESFNKKMSFLNTENASLFGDGKITLELEFEKEVKCNILFDTYNDYFNNSYDVKIKKYLAQEYKEHKLLNNPVNIYHPELPGVNYKELIICTHFAHDEFCPPNYRLFESKTVTVDKEVFRISKYVFLFKNKDVNLFNIPEHCFILVNK